MAAALSIDQDSLKEIQPELRAGETVLWAGRPDTGRIFYFNESNSLLWNRLLSVCFPTVWEGVVIWQLCSTPSNRTPLLFFFALYGIPLVVKAHYDFWGRFLGGMRKKQRTYYAVTNLRVLVVQDCQGRKVASADIDSLPIVVKQSRSGEIGTLRFAPPLDPRRRDWSGMFSLEEQIREELWDPVPIRQGPVFVDIEDVDSVCQLISSLRTSKSEAAVAELLRSRGTHDQHGR